MIKLLRRAARKYADKHHPGLTQTLEEAFIAGARYQAKQDMVLAVEMSKEHLKGGFFKLGTDIAKAIDVSVEE
jgi:hypothetical protein